MLTAERLVLLSNWPHLQNCWHFIAAATFSVCNQPRESSKIMHFALKKSQYQNKFNQIDRETEMQLAKESLLKCEEIRKLKADGKEFSSVENKFHIKEVDNFNSQFKLVSEIREALLKSIALAGLPKTINTLMDLKLCTASQLLEGSRTRRNFDSSNEEVRHTGQMYWDKVYGKVSKRITHQMSSAYPDLWEYTRNHVYGPLLSFNEILPPKYSSLVIISCLVPQDVNPQLKGHLKGAVNNGASFEEIESVRQLAIMISQWCGIKWKEPVVGLKL